MRPPPASKWSSSDKQLVLILVPDGDAIWSLHKTRSLRKFESTCWSGFCRSLNGFTWKVTYRGHQGRGHCGGKWQLYILVPYNQLVKLKQCSPPNWGALWTPFWKFGQRMPGLYVSFLKGQGHQGIFSPGLRAPYEEIVNFYWSTTRAPRQMTRGHVGGNCVCCRSEVSGLGRWIEKGLWNVFYLVFSFFLGFECLNVHIIYLDDCCETSSYLFCTQLACIGPVWGGGVLSALLSSMI